MFIMFNAAGLHSPCNKSWEVISPSWAPWGWCCWLTTVHGGHEGHGSRQSKCTHEFVICHGLLSVVCVVANTDGSLQLSEDEDGNPEVYLQSNITKELFSINLVVSIPPLRLPSVLRDL
jgi:hypothetical protein